jgi:hypothetical protein
MRRERNRKRDAPEVPETRVHLISRSICFLRVPLLRCICPPACQNRAGPQIQRSGGFRSRSKTALPAVDLSPASHVAPLSHRSIRIDVIVVSYATRGPLYQDRFLAIQFSAHFLRIRGGIEGDGLWLVCFHKSIHMLSASDKAHICKPCL